MFCSCRISTDKCLARSFCHSRASCDIIPAACDRQTHDDGIYNTALALRRVVKIIESQLEQQREYETYVVNNAVAKWTAAS